MELNNRPVYQPTSSVVKKSSPKFGQKSTEKPSQSNSFKSKGDRYTPQFGQNRKTPGLLSRVGMGATMLAMLANPFSASVNANRSAQAPGVDPTVATAEADTAAKKPKPISIKSTQVAPAKDAQGKEIPNTSEIQVTLSKPVILKDNDMNRIAPLVIITGKALDPISYAHDPNTPVLVDVELPVEAIEVDPLNPNLLKIKTRGLASTGTTIQIGDDVLVLKKNGKSATVTNSPMAVQAGVITPEEFTISLGGFGGLRPTDENNFSTSVYPNAAPLEPRPAPQTNDPEGYYQNLLIEHLSKGSPALAEKGRELYNREDVKKVFPSPELRFNLGLLLGTDAEPEIPKYLTRNYKAPVDFVQFPSEIQNATAFVVTFEDGSKQIKFNEKYRHELLFSHAIFHEDKHNRDGAGVAEESSILYSDNQILRQIILRDPSLLEPPPGKSVKSEVTRRSMFRVLASLLSGKTPTKDGLLQKPPSGEIAPGGKYFPDLVSATGDLEHSPDTPVEPFHREFLAKYIPADQLAKATTYKELLPILDQYYHPTSSKDIVKLLGMMGMTIDPTAVQTTSNQSSGKSLQRSLDQSVDLDPCVEIIEKNGQFLIKGTNQKIFF